MLGLSQTENKKCNHAEIIATWTAMIVRIQWLFCQSKVTWKWSSEQNYSEMLQINEPYKVQGLNVTVHNSWCIQTKKEDANLLYLILLIIMLSKHLYIWLRETLFSCQSWSNLTHFQSWSRIWVKVLRRCGKVQPCMNQKMASVPCLIWI